MRPSLRFLALAVLGWAGFRIISAGSVPGASFFSKAHRAPKTTTVASTVFPNIEPVKLTASAGTQAQAPTPATIEAPSVVQRFLAAQPPSRHYVRGVVGVPVVMRPGTVTLYELPPVRPANSREIPIRPASLTPDVSLYHPAEYAFLPARSDGPLSLVQSLGALVTRPEGGSANESVPALEKPHLKRLQLASWALLRSQRTGIAGSRSLAPGGQLGASQAGARLLFNVTRQIAISGRLSSPVGTRGGEGAIGVRAQPFGYIPVWVTAERRQAIGRFGGGRNALALLIEGGVYQQPLPWRFALDSYFQAGVVSMRRHDLFFDGGLTVTRPMWSRFSAGFGIWGGAQPHLGRLDVGPRLTMKVRSNLKVHLDWRQKVVGNARPGSGPAVTLAGDF